MSTNLEYLLTPKAIRDRSLKLFQLTEQKKTHWWIDASQIKPCAKYVMTVVEQKYPSWNIPFHSRWGHFQAGGKDRLSELKEKIANVSPEERLKLSWDLAIVSVLLDAGAGMKWSYLDPRDGKKVSKSEGLAVASFDLFMSGAFSSDPKSPYQVDAEGLKNVSLATITKGFQVSEKNPLNGIQGRVDVLNRLGTACAEFQRPSGILSFLGVLEGKKSVAAEDCLNIVLKKFSKIWPGRLEFEGFNLGDTWSHSLLGSPGSFESFVPFHKLSQWMTYSLFEPLQDFGVKVTDLNQMTGLPEYRNGGLFLDFGVIGLNDKSASKRKFKSSDAEIIEWRAITVVLLDQIAAHICKLQNKTPDELPLVKILEGGTWWAGRALAANLRSDGGPPLQIESDGTVF